MNETVKLVNPNDPNDIAIVEPGSAAEAYHVARGLSPEHQPKDRQSDSEISNSTEPARRGPGRQRKSN